MKEQTKKEMLRLLSEIEKIAEREKEDYIETCLATLREAIEEA